MDPYLTGLLVAFLAPPLIALLAVVVFTWTPWHRDLLDRNLRKRLYVAIADAPLEREVDRLVRWVRVVVGCTVGGLLLAVGFAFTLSPASFAAPLLVLFAPLFGVICVAAIAAWPRDSRDGVAAPARISDYIHPVFVYGLRVLAVLNGLVVGSFVWLMTTGAFDASTDPQYTGVQIAALAIVTYAVYEAVGQVIVRRRRMLDRDASLAADVRKRYLLTWFATLPVIWSIQMPTMALSSTRSLRDKVLGDALDDASSYLLPLYFVLLAVLIALTIVFARRIGEHMFRRLWPELPLVHPRELRASRPPERGDTLTP